MNETQVVKTRQMADEDDRWFTVVIVGGALALLGFAVAGNVLAFCVILTQTSFVVKAAAVVIFLMDALLGLLVALERYERQKWVKIAARHQSPRPTG